MNCTDACERQSGLVDGELDSVDRLQLLRHLQGCAACRLRMGYLEAQCAALRRADYFTAPAALRERIAAQLDAGVAAAPRRRPAPAAGPAWRWRWLAGPVALPGVFAAVAMAFALGLYAGLPTRDDRLLEQATTNVRRAFDTGRVVDLASADPAALQPWLAQRAGFEAPVRDLKAAGFELRGARLDELDQRAVAVLVYREGAADVDLFVWPAAAGTGGLPPLQRSHAGMNVLRWSRGGMNYCAVSAGRAEDLERIRALI